MKCFQCDKGNMACQMADVTARVRGEEIPVRTEAMVCDRCGFQVMTDQQSDAYTIASADAYRVKHRLLTGAELRETRSRLKMSQRQFSKHLGVGAASVKRWEAGLVQDDAMDQLIRLKTDLAVAQANVRWLEEWSGKTSSRPQPIRAEWDAPDKPGSAEEVRLLPGFLAEFGCGG